MVLLIKMKFRFEKQSVKAIYAFAYQNIPIFLSEGVTTFHRNIGVVIAGFFLSAPLMGIYIIIDRIMMLIANSYTLVYRAIFPMLCNFVKESDRILTSFLFSIFSKLLVVVLLGMAVVILFGDSLIEMLSDEITLADIGPFLWILPVFIFMLFCNPPLSLLIIARDMKKNLFQLPSDRSYHSTRFTPLFGFFFEDQWIIDQYSFSRIGDGSFWCNRIV